MEIRRLRYLAAALGLALATTAAAIPFTRPAAAEPSARDKQAQTAITTVAWSYVSDATERFEEAVADRQAALLQDAKLALRTGVRAADDLNASAAGKATEVARQALAVERNRAMTAIKLSETVDEVVALEPSLAAARDVVTAEVQAWEAAEAARIAEEARLAEEQRRAQESAGRSRGGGSSGAASGGDTQAYLEGIAGAYGATIAWSDAPCGRGGSSVSGCYAGGSTITVSNSALQSWDVAKGRGRNVVIHEVSHMLIQYTCGTVLLGGERFENVTDAYAILLGAGGTTGYGYNDNDLALAQAALGGQCIEG